jgi:hypothetical protein
MNSNSETEVQIKYNNKIKYYILEYELHDIKLSILSNIHNNMNNLSFVFENYNITYSYIDDDMWLLEPNYLLDEFINIIDIVIPNKDTNLYNDIFNFYCMDNNEYVTTEGLFEILKKINDSFKYDIITISELTIRYYIDKYINSNI